MAIGEKFTDSDGYEIEHLGGHKIRITAPGGGKGAEQQLSEFIQSVAKPFADKLRSMGRNPNDFFQMAGYPIRNSARDHIDHWNAELAAEISKQIEEEDAKLRAVLPGIEELKAAAADEARYGRQFTRMMEDESNDGARPPAAVKVSFAELAQKYSRAALYLRAESFSCASHWAKVKAGEQAMELLLAGGSEADAAAKLENWVEDNKVYVD